MRNHHFAIVLAALATPLFAQDGAIVAQPKADPAARQFAATMAQALGALATAGSYEVRVASTWGSPSDPAAPAGGGRYRLVAHGGKYRVEMQAQTAAAAELVCVNDGQHVTTYYPAAKLYAKHPAGSPQASLEYNKMLALSLQGSALDILLQPDVARFVQGQSGGVKDHGEAVLDAQRTRHFEVVFAGAQVDLWFAAEGVPLLLQFVRRTTVPTGRDQHYELTCTAKFQWKLSAPLDPAAFVLNVPAGARQVAEIYDALSGDDAATLIGKPLPKLQLASLDGADVELAPGPGKKATVLIFWATWCAASIEDLPAVHQFVAAYKQKGVEFYAINVGEQPGVVRRFTAQHQLASTVLLDTHAQSTSALRICELPAVGILAPDGKLQAILHGTAKSLQGELAEQLNGLLQAPGNTASRRPTPATK